jgi:type VI secretion system ImpC/EvpB family protein
MEAKPAAGSPVTVYLPEETESRPAADAPSQALAADTLDGLLGEIVHAAPTARRGEATGAGRLERFLRAESPGRALCVWLGLDGSPAALPTRAQVTRQLTRDIARIDALLSDQVNAILHHPAVQKLEGSWRGLRYLVDKLPDDRTVKIRVLNASWAEIVQDQTRALEFDQSQLFRKVYEAEFGHPGGEPFGVLIGDYEVHHRPSAEHPFDDVEALRKLAGVAASAFAPLLMGVHPSFFGLDSFTELERPMDLSRIFEQPDYLKWRSLRQVEDARFLGLVLPRVLMRLPYESSSARSPRSFAFREDVEGPDCARYLWGNAAYAFGGVLIRSFCASNWLADIRGFRQGTDERGNRYCLDEGGLVTDLLAHSFATDHRGVATKCPTDVVLTDSQEKELGELGFIPLCHCVDTEYAAFYGNQSIQRPARYDDPKATANARLSAMLQYILCVSRFAHYLKVIGRDKVGSMLGPEDCESQLQRWLQSYVTASDSAGPEVKAKYPLREAKVQVRELPDRPGTYGCVIHLRPHFQLDQMVTSVKFSTELAPGRPE